MTVSSTMGSPLQWIAPHTTGKMDVVEPDGVQETQEFVVRCLTEKNAYGKRVSERHGRHHLLLLAGVAGGTSSAVRRTISS